MKNIESLISVLPKGVAYVIENPINIRYLTGCSIDTGVLIIIDNTVYFSTDFRYIEVAENYFASSTVQVIMHKKLTETVIEVLKKHNVDKLALEVEYQTLAREEFYRNCCPNIITDGDLDKKINELKLCKQPYEIESIKKAQQLTDDAFSYILKYIKCGVKERDIALELEMYMRKNGSEDISFDIIAVSGKTSSSPHGVPSDKLIENGDFLTMDFGCKVNGYCSDMTRTIAIGYATDEMKTVYNTVLSAQKAALAKVKAGAICMDVDKAARDIINNAGYEGYFGHATGHGVGLYIHEDPHLSANSETSLKSGMIVTVEPGIYLKGKFGVRIEDMVVVTDDGCIDFTGSEKDLIIL